jgi:voltage-gated potassium channel
MFSSKRLKFLALLPLVVIIIGTFGFMWLEKLSFLNALYFTVTTITTVGYGDITPATAGGKIFTIVIILVGVSTVLAILSNILQYFIQRQQRVMHGHRRNMLIGVFFTEAGNELLRIFCGYDPDIAAIRKDFLVKADWTAEQYQKLKSTLSHHKFEVDPARIELEKLSVILQKKGDLLVRQLENADLTEVEDFAELLWAIVHLRDELSARPSFNNLPKSDYAHLANDIKRAYSQLTARWIDHLQFLKTRYPFLFSLALRTNPFVENPDAVVKG